MPRLQSVGLLLRGRSLFLGVGVLSGMVLRGSLLPRVDEKHNQSPS